MIDVTDPRNEHLITHPHFLKGVEHERERVLGLLVCDVEKCPQGKLEPCPKCDAVKNAIRLIEGEQS